MAQQIEHIKWINGTNFMVDGFNFQNPRCKNYFLTHFHSDHTTGLNRSFSSGVVFCSPITATLLIKDMGLPAERVIPLPMDEPHVIDGVTVTLMDANHCPGACMMLFKVPVKGSKPQMLLHTGDMRWQPRLADHPALKACKVDVLYMDTTYCSPKHVFPSQDNAIATLVRVMSEAYAEERKTLFVVGSYHIGKERAFLGAAKALDFRIWCHQAKKKVMEWCEVPAADMRRIVSKESAAHIHVVFMGQGLQPEALEQRRLKGDYVKVVAFRPTGWSYQKKGLQTRREGNVTIYGIPYSEHSSFAELRDCVKRLRPKRLIPTVNCPDAASARAIVDRFADLMDLSRDKSRLDCYFGRTSSAPVCSTSSCRPPMEHTASAYSPEHSTAPAETKLLLEAVKTEPARCPAYTGQQDELKSSTQSCNHHVITDDDSQDAIGGFLSPENITGQDCQPQGQSSHAPFQTAAVPIGCASEGQAEKEEHDATYPLGWADDDENGSDVSNSPLPLRRLAGPGHAFSAPAALGQGTEAQWDDESEVDGLSQPLMPDSVQNQQELLVTLHQCSPAEVSTRPMAVAKGQGLQKAIDDLHQLNRDTAKQQAAVSDNNQLRTEGACPDPDDAELYSVEGCDKHTHAAQQDVIVKDVPAFVMDSIDIAEQTRILSHIQQEALHARQCLPTKKRQLTLGCFVVPKRVK